MLHYDFKCTKIVSISCHIFEKNKDPVPLPYPGVNLGTPFFGQLFHKSTPGLVEVR